MNYPPEKEGLDRDVFWNPASLPGRNLSQRRKCASKGLSGALGLWQNTGRPFLSSYD
jgi:hypothetical protein